MLSRVKRFLSEPSRFQKDVDPVERFARSGWSRLTTPDQLVAARVIELITQDFEGWKHVFGYPRATYPKRSRHACTQAGDDVSIQYKDGLSVKAVSQEHRQSSERYPEDVYKVTFTNLIVNNVALEAGLADEVFGVYFSMKNTFDKAKEVARQASRAMQENEKKWNLAERLLNMKRDETGALVPIDKIGGNVLPGDMREENGALVPVVEPTHAMVINGRGTFESWAGRKDYTFWLGPDGENPDRGCAGLPTIYPYKRAFISI